MMQKLQSQFLLIQVLVKSCLIVHVVESNLTVKLAVPLSVVPVAVVFAISLIFIFVIKHYKNRVGRRLINK